MSTCVLETVSPVHSFTSGKAPVNGTLDAPVERVLSRYSTCHTDMPSQTEELNQLIASIASSVGVGCTWSGQRVRRAAARAHLSLRLQVFRWDFDVCVLARLSGGRPLYVTFMAIIQQLGLLVRACASRLPPG
jgi:hypothetical protein